MVKPRRIELLWMRQNPGGSTLRLGAPVLIAFIRRETALDRIQSFVQHQYAAQSLTAVDILDIFLPTAFVKHGKGLADILRLIGQPRQAFHLVQRQIIIVVVDLLFQVAYVFVHRALRFPAAVCDGEQEHPQQQNNADQNEKHDDPELLLLHGYSLSYQLHASFSFRAKSMSSE